MSFRTRRQCCVPSGNGQAIDCPTVKPSKAVPPTTYRSVEPKLFERIIDWTVAGPGKSGIGGAPRPPLHQAGG